MFWLVAGVGAVALWAKDCADLHAGPPPKVDTSPVDNNGGTPGVAIPTDGGILWSPADGGDGGLFSPRYADGGMSVMRHDAGTTTMRRDAGRTTTDGGMSVSPDAGPTQDEHPNGNRDECILTYDDSHVCDAVNTKTIQNIGNVSITIATFNDCGQITICPQEVVVLDSATADYLLRAGPTLFEDTATPDVDAGFLSDAGGVHQSESDGGLDAGLVSDAGSSHQPGTDGGVINRCDRIRYDFETDDGGFLTGGNPPTLWQWGTPHRGQGPGGAANGSKCWGTNLSQNYPDDANATLTMPILHLSAGTTPVLQFQQWLQTESCCDAGVVEASIDAGRTWIALQEFRGNAALAWTPVSIDLSSLAGNDVTIRWHFRSDGSVTYPGWYVDDVQITGLSCFDSADAGSTGQSVDGGAISGNP